MYKRKTANAAELAEACRRAAKMRKHNRGGRPRMPENATPSKSIRVRGDDAAVLNAFAKENGISLTYAVHVLAVCLVNGQKLSPHPTFVPRGREAFFKGF